VRVLVACEHSARLRDAFRAHGHDAWSADLKATDGDPSWHYQRDVLRLLDRGWDLMVAFPPCTYLTKANAPRWAEIADQREQALDFVRALLAAPIPHIAVENPVGAVGTHIRPADQYIQPWQFGEPYRKKTGLWLHNLPKLVPEAAVEPANVEPWHRSMYGPRQANGKRRTRGVARTPRHRSLTFPGIARAMAEQWGTLAG
jgi:hypothetical protein